MYVNFKGKPTDADMAKYPTVILTEPHEGNPSALDYTDPTSSGLIQFGPLTLQHETCIIPG